MKIGILGSGPHRKTLARKLGAAGHEVKVANSRGPETIDGASLADEDDRQRCYQPATRCAKKWPSRRCREGQYCRVRGGAGQQHL
jgi:predicted dinucleotide-binding enzyme